MIKALVLAVALLPSRADSVQYYYANADAEALRQLCRAPLSVEEDLLCRYRLYPLTLDGTLLEDLPSQLEDASAREKAILAGLWGYRASTGSIFNSIRCGRRSERLMSEARREAPKEPFVLLVEGQSLLFRPAVFGGDNHRALEAFRELERVIEARSDDSITRMEVELWIWFCLRRLGDPGAEVVRERIESRQPPPLYADFLRNPPS